MSIDNQAALSLDARLKTVTIELRDLFNELDLSYLKLSIEVQGRPTGALEVIYRIGDSSYYSDSGNVEGAALVPVVEEFLRRKGWKERNAPTMIPYVSGAS